MSADDRAIAGEDKLTLYQWNTKIARHYFCSVCGIYPFHRKRSMPDHYGITCAASPTSTPTQFPSAARKERR